MEGCNDDDLFQQYQHNVNINFVDFAKHESLDPCMMFLILNTLKCTGIGV
jgi:hypothetical protein